MSKDISFLVATDDVINLSFPTGKNVDFDFPHDDSSVVCTLSSQKKFSLFSKSELEN